MIKLTNEEFLNYLDVAKETDEKFVVVTTPSCVVCKDIFDKEGSNFYSEEGAALTYFSPSRDGMTHLWKYEFDGNGEVGKRLNALGLSRVPVLLQKIVSHNSDAPDSQFYHKKTELDNEDDLKEALN